MCAASGEFYLNQIKFSCRKPHSLDIRHYGKILFESNKKVPLFLIWLFEKDLLYLLYRNNKHKKIEYGNDTDANNINLQRTTEQTLTRSEKGN